jgi:hypothetical protein
LRVLNFDRNAGTLIICVNIRDWPPLLGGTLYGDTTKVILVRQESDSRVDAALAAEPSNLFT